MKPWREIAVPHQDVLKGTFQQSAFAADLAKVLEGTAPEGYLDPVAFFDRLPVGYLGSALKDPEFQGPIREASASGCY